MRSTLALALALLTAPVLHAQADSSRNLAEAFQRAGQASAARDWKAARAALQPRFAPRRVYYIADAQLDRLADDQSLKAGTGALGGPPDAARRRVRGVAPP